MHWDTEQAQQHFTQLLKAATEAPQQIFQHNQLTAVVIDAADFAQFEQWQAQQKQCLGTAFSELRTLCTQEDYQLDLPARTDRENTFS